MESFLLIDIGNSMVDCYLIKNNKGVFYNFPTKIREIGENFFLKLGEIIAEEKLNLSVYISSVNSKALELLLEKLDSRGVVRIKVLNSKIMKRYAEVHGYKITNTSVLGGDLFADVVGSADPSVRSEIIVDLGTATKVLAVDENKEFLGGMIFPGIHSCSRILADKTDLLQDRPISLPREIVSLVTVEAINAGTLYGTAFMVLGFIKEIKKRYQFENVVPVLTGGGASIIAQAFEAIGERDFVYDRLRILRGLANAFELKDKLQGVDLYEKK